MKCQPILFKKKKQQLGIGLIELMISMLIGLFIMAGVVQLFSTSSQNAVAAAGASRIQENIRYVFSRMAEDISQSGNLGCISTTNMTLNNAVFMDNLLGLASAAGEANDFSSIINGDDSATATTDPAGLVATGTDTFRIRYVNQGFRIDLAASVEEGDSSIVVDSADSNYSQLVQYQVVALTNCSKGAVFMITNDPSGSAGVIEFNTGIVAPAGINEGQENIKNLIEASEAFGLVDGSSSATSPTYLYGGSTGSYLYFVGTSAAAGGNTCALVTGTTSGPQFCALFRRDRSGSQELVEGVHDLQVMYGWTDTANQLFFAPASDAAIDWPRVDRVKVDISFNSIDNVVVNGNAIDNTATGLLRKTVSRTFNLSNQL